MREIAVYECAGKHRDYFGWFGFLEEEYTGWSRKFDTVEEAEAFIDMELGLVPENVREFLSETKLQGA